MTANAIHMTGTSATIAGNLSTGALTSGTGGGEIDLLDRFSVGQTVQVMMRSNGVNEWEEGYCTVEASNSLSRDQPMTTYNGTTLDSSSPTRLSFTTGHTIDVWVTPVSGGVIEAPIVDMTNITSNMTVNHALSAHISGGSGFGTAVVADQLYVLPYYKIDNTDITGFWLYVNATFAGNKLRIAIHESAADGSIGLRLAETTDWAPGTGEVEKLLAPAIPGPAGLYYLVFLSDYAGGLRYWQSENHLLPVNIASTTSPISYLYKAAIGWSATAETAIPAIPADLTVSGSNNFVTVGLVTAA